MSRTIERKFTWPVAIIDGKYFTLSCHLFVTPFQCVPASHTTHSVHQSLNVYLKVTKSTEEEQSFPKFNLIQKVNADGCVTMKEMTFSQKYSQNNLMYLAAVQVINPASLM